MEWTFVGNAGNAADTTTFGAVGYNYNVGTFEVSNSQYAEFLNAKAAADPFGLYSVQMGGGFGGITRTGVSGSFTYTAIAGRGNMPVNYVSFYDTLRFSNWMNNGQGAGDTETGAYTLLGGTPAPSNGATVARNAGQTIFLASQDEWYKAAYYDAVSTSYFGYPTGTNAVPTCAAPTATPNRANCGAAVGDLTIKGSYTGSDSPYGTFDQGGNVYEWNESAPGAAHIVRGGAFNTLAPLLGVGGLVPNINTSENQNVGFRLAMIPEPGTGALLAIGMIGLAYRRRRAC